MSLKDTAQKERLLVYEFRRQTEIVIEYLTLDITKNL